MEISSNRTSEVSEATQVGVYLGIERAKRVRPRECIFGDPCVVLLKWCASAAGRVHRARRYRFIKRLASKSIAKLKAIEFCELLLVVNEWNQCYITVTSTGTYDPPAVACQTKTIRAPFLGTYLNETPAGSVFDAPLACRSRLPTPLS